MTTAAICEIVNALHRLGIGMAEAKVFVAVDSNTMRIIADKVKISLKYSENQLRTLRQKGLVKIDSTTRPATYSHTKDGQIAMKTLIAAGMKK